MVGMVLSTLLAFAGCSVENRDGLLLRYDGMRSTDSATPLDAAASANLGRTQDSGLLEVALEAGLATETQTEAGVMDAGRDARLAGVIEIPIATSADDALQNPDGSVLIDGGWLSLYSDAHWVGLRFSLAQLPADANVSAAYLRLYLDSDEESAPNGGISIETSAFPAPFSGTPNELSNRPRTQGFVPWIAPARGEGWISSPSLLPLLRVHLSAAPNRSDRHIVFLWDASAKANVDFEFRSFDFPKGPGVSFTPVLVVHYD